MENLTIPAEQGPSPDSSKHRTGVARSGDDREGFNPEVGPLTVSTLSRFFGVPLLIISTIVGGACAVVLLFGGPSSQPRSSVDELLQVLESNSGERSLGILLPREKELWQAALELSQRLQAKNGELSPEEMKAAAERLTTMIRADLSALDEISSFGVDRVNQRELRSGRLAFLIHALGRTGLEEAVEPLAAIVRSGAEPFVATAIVELGNLHEMPLARATAPLVADALGSSKRRETQLVACTAVSVLADPGDDGAIVALRTQLRRQEGEVAWCAALSLARLGDSKGKTTLMDMLERSFWEQGERYELLDRGGAIRRYPMPASRVDQYLISAIDAASRLDDADLWELIERLQSDDSLAVKARATQAVQARAGKGDRSAN